MVSVIVPVFNTGKYLHKCLNSLLSQTDSGIEIVIVDDGSTDESPAICDAYAKKYKNVVVIHQANKGVSSARNAGIEAATGEYIGFVDSDDYVKENYIEVMRKAMEEDGSDVAECNVERESGEKKEIVLDMNREKLQGGQILKSLRRTNNKTFPEIYGPCWRRLFKAKIIKDNHLSFPPAIKIGEDQVFLASYMDFVRCASSVPDALYVYVDSDTSACNEALGKDKAERLRALIGPFLHLAEHSRNAGVRKWCRQVVASQCYNILIPFWKTKDIERLEEEQKLLRRFLLDFLPLRRGIKKKGIAAGMVYPHLFYFCRGGYRCAKKAFKRKGIQSGGKTLL